MAGSRHKEELSIYTSEEIDNELRNGMAQQGQKDMALDYVFSGEKIDMKELGNIEIER